MNTLPKTNEIKEQSLLFTDEELQEKYISLNSNKFNFLCQSTKDRLEHIENKFVEEVLNTCSKTRRITFKQFKVLYKYNTTTIPEYRDFN